jgi:hypothetical protein
MAVACDCLVAQDRQRNRTATTMPATTNPLKLNGLQLRSLALLQVIARQPNLAHTDPTSGDTVLAGLPHAHGDHMHVGPFTVPARDASGLANPSVWAALARKGLARRDAVSATLTAAGLDYDTGLSDRFVAASDH